MKRRMDSTRGFRQRTGPAIFGVVSLAALLLLAGCSQIMSNLNEDGSAEEQKESIEPAETEGFLGEVHKENAGTFMFATEPITRGVIIVRRLAS